MTNESSAEISLVSELPGAFHILENTVIEQHTHSLLEKVTKTVHGRSHGTRRNRSSHLVQQIKRYDYTTTVSPLLQRASLHPVENQSSSLTLRSLRDTQRRFGLWLGLLLGTPWRRVRSIRTLGSGSKSEARTKKEYGSA